MKNILREEKKSKIKEEETGESSKKDGSNKRKPELGESGGESSRWKKIKSEFLETQRNPNLVKVQMDDDLQPVLALTEEPLEEGEIREDQSNPIVVTQKEPVIQPSDTVMSEIPIVSPSLRVKSKISH